MSTPDLATSSLTPGGSCRSGTPEVAEAQRAARRRAAEDRRVLLGALADEIARFEADKRGWLQKLNTWVANWVRDYQVGVDDLDGRGSPRPDRVAPEAISKWTAYLTAMAEAIDARRDQHEEAMDVLRDRLERRHGAARGPEVLMGQPDGVAVSLATRHAITMLDRLEPVYPR